MNKNAGKNNASLFSQILDYYSTADKYIHSKTHSNAHQSVYTKESDKYQWLVLEQKSQCEVEVRQTDSHGTITARDNYVLTGNLPKGYKIAIVTTKFHYRIEQILSKFDANELIDIIVGAEDVKIEKPNPEGLLWAIEHLDAMNDEVLYIGDSLVDAKTAENAKVEFVAVLTGTTTRDDFRSYNSAYIGENISDVCKYILTL